MRAFASIFASVLVACLCATGCEEAPGPEVTPLAVQGAAIDGSEDSAPSPSEEVESPESAARAAYADADAAPHEAEDASGPLEISYQDLSLVDYDVDAMLDCMLFPDEYDEDDREYLAWPDSITRLMGREVSIVGYMIPGEMEQGEVRDFMLVRDLLGCCFGGTPMPDEWVDVVMAEGEVAEYRPYVPMRVTGELRLEGEQDEAGFAMGIFRMRATKVEVEE